MDELDAINKHFRDFVSDNSLELGIGDDCALFNVLDNDRLLITTDTVVQGRHFPPDAPARALGYRSCAVALSDIAAMGGKARWASLALTIDELYEPWMDGFCAGIKEALALDETCLTGGDLTQGPLCISWTVIGAISGSHCLTRAGAKVGDDVYVSGQLGGASAALQYLDENATKPPIQQLQRRYWHPQPRLALGRDLVNIASSCIDVSDGLLADLGHIATMSECAIDLFNSAIPRDSALPMTLMSDDEQQRCVLTGGDDYELCFTASPDYRQQLAQLSERHAPAISRIGRVREGRGVVVLDEHGESIEVKNSGYRHFQMSGN